MGPSLKRFSDLFTGAFQWMRSTEGTPVVPACTDGNGANPSASQTSMIQSSGQPSSRQASTTAKQPTQPPQGTQGTQAIQAIHKSKRRHTQYPTYASPLYLVASLLALDTAILIGFHFHDPPYRYLHYLPEVDPLPGETTEDIKFKYICPISSFFGTSLFVK